MDTLGLPDTHQDNLRRTLELGMVAKQWQKIGY